MTPEAYCATQGAPAGSSVYYALLYHRPPERRAAHACFAFLEELRRDALRRADPTPVVTRLQWWLQQLPPPPSATSTHPVLAELRLLETAPGLLASLFAPAVAAALRDVTGFVPDTATHWLEHGRMQAAGPWQLAAQFAGTTRTDPEAVGLLAARCTQMAQLLELTARTTLGRCPLPAELLARHGATLAPELAWQTDPRVHGAIADAARMIRHGIASALDVPAPLPLFCRVLGRINLALCHHVERHPARLCRERSALTPLRKLWIAWRERQSGA